MPIEQPNRVKILNESDVTELYGLPSFNQSDQEFYFALNAREHEVFASRDTVHSKMYFVLLLGYFKNKPISVDFNFTEVRKDLEYILQTYIPSKKVPRQTLSRQLKSRLYNLVYQLMDYKKFDAQTEAKLLLRAESEVLICIEPRHIFDDCIDHLAYERIVIPSYSRLQKIVSAALNSAQKQTEKILSTEISKNLKQLMLRILDSEETNSILTSMKRLPKDFTNKELSKEIETYEIIKSMFSDVEHILKRLKLSPKNIDYYASLVDYYSINKLRRFSNEACSLYIVCYLSKRYRQINENFVNAFIYHVRKITDEAITDSKKKVYESLLNINDKIKQASIILNYYVDEKLTDDLAFREVRKKAFKVLDKKDIPIVSGFMADIDLDRRRFEWEFIDNNQHRVRTVIRKLFHCMAFTSREDSSVLFDQMVKSQFELSSTGKLVEFDQRLISKRLKPYLMQNKDNEPAVLIGRAEMHLYRRIKEKIDTGHILIENSFSYKRFESDLVADDIWQEGKEDLILRSNLPSLQIPISQHLAMKYAELESKLTEVSERLTNGENQSVVYSDSKGNTTWSIKRRPKSKDVNNPFFEKLPQTHISDLMVFVNSETKFFDAFTHINSKNQKKPADLGAIIACVVANATRFGANKMANICEVSLERLRSTQRNFLRLETLQDANDLISNTVAKLPIFRHYNIQENVIHASSDGQKFESKKSTLRTRFSSKYLGKGKGLSAITLSANHIPINAKVMGLNEHESHHIFDLLYNNTSDINPDVLSTDFHGTNQVNFGLLDMFGWKFAPRYPKFGHVIADLFKVTGDQRLLELKKPIRTAMIEADWDFIQRIIISLQRKEATQATIVKKLSSYKSNSKLFQALTEYDRLIKAIYVLEYLDDESLRHYVHRALNRGEAYHQLQRAIEAINGGKFRGNSDNEINVWNECSRLISNSIIYFNSAILSKLLIHYERHNNTEMLSLIKTLSPVAWVNINLNGTYSFAIDSTILDIDEILNILTKN
jgi:TnpA family transposase